MNHIMETKSNLKELVPFKATHPGSIIADELEYLGYKHNEFAKLIGMQSTHFSSLLKGRRSLSPDIALKIELHTDLQAEQLMALQSKYELDCKRIAKREIEDSMAKTKLAEISAIINIPLLVRDNHIKTNHAKDILNFFEHKYLKSYEIIRSIDNNLYGYFKKSNKTIIDERNLKTWLLLAINKINQDVIEETYSEGNAELAANEIAHFTNSGKISVNDIETILKKYGIKFCHVKKLNQVPVDAFSTMTSHGNPAIVATYRHNDMNKLVFDILHELGHITLQISLGKSFIKIGDELSSDEYELEADAFARDILIAPNVWKAIMRSGSKLLESLDFHRIVNSVAKVAKENGINPTIAVSRYKRESGQYNISRYRSPAIH